MSGLRAGLCGFLVLILGPWASAQSTDVGTHELAGPVKVLWETRYDGPASGYDYGSVVGVSQDGSLVFVAGSETEPDASYHFVTRALDAATGDEVWASRFDPPRSSGIPRVLVVSPDGRSVFVTGDSGLDFLTLAYDAATGEQRWAARYHGPWYEDWGYVMDVSPDGATVFVGGASQDVDGEHDIVTVAYDGTSGTELWVARYDGPGHDADWDDWTNDIAVAPDGATLFVTGQSSGIGTEWDIVTLAYDAVTGEERWIARRDGSASWDDAGSGIVVSPDGATVFVTGQSAELGRDLDCIVLAYDAQSGEEVWATLYDGPPSQHDAGTVATISADGRTLFVNGTSRGTESIPDFDVLTLALDPTTGGLIWTARYGGLAGGYDYGETIGLSPDGATVYVAGGSDGTASDRDAVALAYDAATGREIWSARYDGPAQQYDVFRRLAVSPLGATVYAIGPSTGVGTSRDWAVVAYTAWTPDEIAIDIKPQDDSNRINARHQGVLPVAVLGSLSFDVQEIDPSTLRFGPGAAPPFHDLSRPDTWSDHLQDVNLDGVIDLMLHFRMPAIGLGCDDESATLTGSTRGGQDFEGRDLISTVGCRGRSRLQAVTPNLDLTEPRIRIEMP